MASYKNENCGRKAKGKDGQYLYSSEYSENGGSGGFIYKNSVAFHEPWRYKDKNEIVYIPEYGFPANKSKSVPVDKLQSYYTRQDFIKLTNSEELAAELFDELTWQHPENLWNEWCEDSCHNDNWIESQWAYEKVYLPEFAVGVDRKGQEPVSSLEFFDVEWQDNEYRKYCFKRLEEILNGNGMIDKTFEYGGYHFTPERQLSPMENSLKYICRHQRIDPELGFCRKNYNYKSKFEYSYDSFYAVATEKEYDLFRCEENGKLYIPCENDLQEYVEENLIEQKEHICDMVKASVAKEFAEFRSTEIAQSAEAVFDNNCQVHFYSRVANYFEYDDKQFYEKNAIRCLQKYTGHILEYLWDYYLNCDQAVNLESSLGVYSFIRDFNGEYMAYGEQSGEME